MRSAVKYLLALAAAGLFAAGCDWRDFDTLQNQVPVERVDAPSGFQSTSDFATAVLPVAPPADGSAAAWFLASGSENLGLALVKVDPAGNTSGQTLSGTALDNLAGNPITALAEIPGTGTALLGAPTSFNPLVTVTLATATVSAFTPTSATAGSENLFGDGVAVGTLTGAASPDYVVTSQTSIHVFVDGATTDIVPGASDLAACPIALSSSLVGNFKATRAVVIGNLLGSGPVIAVGTPGVGAAGTVSFFNVASGAVTCAGVLDAPALSGTTINLGFGGALAVGDFDGDGAADLLVGAPPHAVYLYKGPLTLSGAAPTATISPPLGSAEFGAALAAMNIDGKTGDEALIGDPGATVDNQTGAGNVTIYTGPKLADMLTPTAVLTDHDLSAGEAYGGSIDALPFCATPPCASPPRLPLVGAPAHAFIYFTLGPTDPRSR
jgi:hypothetical protein